MPGSSTSSPSSEAAGPAAKENAPPSSKKVRITLKKKAPPQEPDPVASQLQEAAGPKPKKRKRVTSPAPNRKLRPRTK